MGRGVRGIILPPNFFGARRGAELLEFARRAIESSLELAERVEAA